MLYITNLSSQENVDRPRGAMDSVSDFGSEGCEFKSRRGQLFFWGGRKDLIYEKFHDEKTTKLRTECSHECARKACVRVPHAQDLIYEALNDWRRS